METSLMNLTPHGINIDAPSGITMTIPPSGTVARVITEEEIIGNALVGVPVVRTRIVGVQGLENIPAGASIIVSSMVLDTLAQIGVPEGIIPFAPDTGATARRDERGQIAAVTRLRSISTMHP